MDDVGSKIIVLTARIESIINIKQVDSLIKIDQMSRNRESSLVMVSRKSEHALDIGKPSGSATCITGGARDPSNNLQDDQ